MESPAATSSAGPSVQPANGTPPQPQPSSPRNNCITGQRRHRPSKGARKPLINDGQRPADPCKVLVTGFPQFAQPQDLVHAFASVEGPAPTVHFLDVDAACLQFAQPHQAAAAILLHHKAIVYGEFVSVRECRPEDEGPNTSRHHLLKMYNKREFPRTKDKDERIVRPEQLDLSGEFSSQMDGLLAAVRLTEHEAAALAALYADVQAALRQHFPGCEALPFGSITTGLGTKTSDADCYVQLPPDQRYLVHNMVLRAKRILQQHPKVFAELLAIPRANTPIIKFHHLPTGTNCDLSFKSPLGYRNSQLLAHLLRADPRLVPLAVLLKYWAKVHQLTGTGRLSNYALTMCVVLYLQRAGLVPSVRALQVDPRHEHTVDGWNTGYDPAPLAPSPTVAAAPPLSHLVGGFFEFYETFDWERYVVCPYLGAPVERDTFTDVARAGAEWEVYARNVLCQRAAPLRLTAMCVQDPVELSHNVAAGVTARHLQELRAHVEHAAAAYRRHRADRCRRLLHDILLLEPPPPPDAHPNPSEYHMCVPVPPAAALPGDWVRAVRRALLHVFQRLLLMPLTLMPAPVTSKGRAARERGAGTLLREQYAGVVTAPVWNRRQLDAQYELLRMEFGSRQRRVTEEIVHLNKAALNVPYRMCVVYRRERLVRVVVRDAGEGDVELIRQLGRFLIGVLPHWVNLRLEQRRAGQGSDSDTGGGGERPSPPPHHTPAAANGQTCNDADTGGGGEKQHSSTLQSPSPHHTPVPAGLADGQTCNDSDSGGEREDPYPPPHHSPTPAPAVVTDGQTCNESGGEREDPSPPPHQPPTPAPAVVADGQTCNESGGEREDPSPPPHQPPTPAPAVVADGQTCNDVTNDICTNTEQSLNLH